MADHDDGCGRRTFGPRVSGDDLTRYTGAVARLNATIDPTWAPADRGLAAVRDRAEQRLARVREFLAHLGNPHRSFPVVHVGGTSGKGSTSTAIASILTAAGYRTGLHTSPYLQVATEKLQINGRLISANVFAELVDDVIAASTTWLGKRPGRTPLTYGELWMAFVATWFAQERVDIAVIEVGAGGRYDLTNVVQPAVSVITSIGLDHTATLGPTLAEIAWHKAGIIKHGAPVVTAVTDPFSLGPIAREAATVATPLIQVRPGTTYQPIDEESSSGQLQEIRPDGALGSVYRSTTRGSTSRINAAVAIAAVRELGKRGLSVTDEAMQQGLAAARIPARFELMPPRGTVNTLIDGAHNAEKVRALLTDLPTLLPALDRSPPILVFAALDSKDPETMLRSLVHHSDSVVATTAPVLGKSSLSASALADIARHVGATGEIIAEPNAMDALHSAHDLAERRSSPLLVTGSLYLAGAVRGWWYPDSAVLKQRTPWPSFPPAIEDCMSGP